MRTVKDQQTRKGRRDSFGAPAGAGVKTENPNSSIFDDLSDLDRPSKGTAESGEPPTLRPRNLEALIDISKAINSTLVLDEILKRVMNHAIELLNAERGFLMLLDDEGELKVRIAHNIKKESLSSAADLQISRTVADRVAAKGQSEYTSNAQEDSRYAGSRSVAELDLRFIICVPLKLRERVIGVCYLDNQSRAGLFGKSDLRLFELFAEQAAIAIENAKLYERLLSLTRYNENVVNKTPLGIVVVDDQLRMITINDAAQQIWRSPDRLWDARQMVDESRSLLDIVPESDRPWWEHTLSEVLSGHKPLTKDKYFLKIGGRESVLSIKISPLNGIEGEKQKMIIVTEDITEKVVMEKFVNLSERMVAKGEMAASIGHELNNHLEILSAHAELLPIHLRANHLGKISESCQKIQDSIDAMARFTRGLMDYIQLDTELVEQNVQEVIEEHLFTLRPLRAFASVRFHCDFRPELPPVKLDVGQIHSVLLNLYNNAVEAAQPGRPLQVDIAAQTCTDEPCIELTIHDNGQGMSAEVRQRLFEPRFTTKKDGHGLGLANCRKIIENHGGTIRCESRAGQGTTFFIRLPISQTYSSFDS
ncbi:MAG TPA: ATP-binding protein [candidate division Zixibacteria bacterium]|jgi:two-component system NtrC family sensor kinase